MPRLEEVVPPGTCLGADMSILFTILFVAMVESHQQMLRIGEQAVANIWSSGFDVAVPKE